MKAILTKYHGQTNTKPARVSASDSGNRNRISVKVSSYASAEKAHIGAAIKLCRIMGWKGPLMQGGFENGDQVFTFDAHANRIRFSMDNPDMDKYDNGAHGPKRFYERY